MTIESTNDNTPITPAITYSECYAQVFLGDCLIESDKIESGTVDLILTDLPYGTMKGINNPERPKSWGNKEYLKWDDSIEPKRIYEIANRILRKNGKMVLFSQEPYTSKMITEAIPNIPFNYRMIWEKNDFANALLCNKAPVSYFEDVIVFSKMHDILGIHPLNEYAKQISDYTKYSRVKFFKMLGHYKFLHFIEAKENRGQSTLCTEDTYKELIEVFGIDNMNGFKNFAELKTIDEQFKNELASTFNLWEGNKYKSNILKYKKDYNGYHPTQKPILLLEDLIKTFSNENDLVVDLTMGSGSTGVACKNTNRSFIGIEKDENYFKIAEQRINARTLFS